MNSRRQMTAISAFLLFLTAGCASVYFPEVEANAFELKKTHPDQVVLENHQEVHLSLVEGRPVAQRRTWLRTHLTSTRGSRSLPLGMHYDKNFDSKVSYEVQFTKKDGEKIGFDRSQMSDVASYGYAISDTRYLIPPMRPSNGFIVDERREKVSSRADLFAYSHHFGHSAAFVRNSSFKICSPKDWTFTFGVFLQNKELQWSPVEKIHENLRCYTFEKHDLQPVPAVAQGPGSNYRMVRVVAALKSWRSEGILKEEKHTPQSFSAKNYALYRSSDDEYGDVMQITPSIRRLAAKIVAKRRAKNQREKAAALYAHVRDTVEYCAIELGMGGWKPYAADDVRKKGYGDCKDKATFLSVLLQSQGISSHPAGIYSHQGMPKRFTIPALGANFNHAILQVHLDDESVFVDPTTRSVPFGQLPINDEYADILPFSKRGEVLQRTPLQGSDVHRSKVEAWWTTNTKDKGRFVVVEEGHFASRTRSALLYRPKGLWHEVANNALKRISRKSDETEAVHVDNATPPLFAEPVLLRGALPMQKGPRSTATRRVSSFASYLNPIFRQAADVDIDDRQQPLLLRFLRREEDIVHLKLLDGWVAVKIPPTYVQETPWFKVSLSMEERKGELVIHRVVEVFRREVLAKDVKRFSKELHLLAVANKRRVFLERSAP
ncbi:MAG: transglutaminase domain-containing protein [Deltaproteobacteria bacterium]|nr:transglutaminase domain-containing protein [Deltaproteobacteria bacterium]